MFYRVLIVLLSIMITFCWSGSFPLDDELGGIMEGYNPPAITAVVFNCEGIVDLDTKGLKKLGSDSPTGIDDQFHIGSITKSFTSLLAMILSKEGLIDLDKPFIEVFPEFKGTVGKSCESLTINLLLDHRATLPPFTLKQSWNMVPQFKGSIVEKRKEFTLWLLSHYDISINNEVNYTNSGYNIAAAMIEKVTGKEWEELVSEKIFKRFNLVSGGFGNPAKDDSNGVWGHWQQWIGKTPTVPVSPISEGLNPIEAPSGDIHMSIKDLGRYGVIHLRGIHGKETDVSSKIFSDIHIMDKRYSKGWYMGNYFGHNVSYHWGSPGTFIAGIYLSHDREIGVAVMANSSDNGTKEGCRVLVEKILKRY